MPPGRWKSTHCRTPLEPGLALFPGVELRASIRSTFGECYLFQVVFQGVSTFGRCHLPSCCLKGGSRLSSRHRGGAHHHFVAQLIIGFPSPWIRNRNQGKSSSAIHPPHMKFLGPLGISAPHSPLQRDFLNSPFVNNPYSLL